MTSCTERFFPTQKNSFLRILQVPVSYILCVCVCVWGGRGGGGEYTCTTMQVKKNIQGEHK